MEHNVVITIYKGPYSWDSSCLIQQEQKCQNWSSIKVPSRFIRVVVLARIIDHMYSSVKNHFGQESEERWSIGCKKRLSRGAQVLGQTLCLSMHHNLHCNTCHFLPEHTGTHTHNDDEELNGWFEVLNAPCLPLVHHAHSTQTANSEQPSWVAFWSGSYMLNTASILIIEQKQKKNENEKTRGGSRSLVYTLAGTSCNRRNKHRLSGLPRCLTRSNHIQQQTGGTGRKTAKWKRKNEKRISKLIVHTAQHIMYQTHQTHTI